MENYLCSLFFGKIFEINFIYDKMWYNIILKIVYCLLYQWKLNETEKGVFYAFVSLL